MTTPGYIADTEFAQGDFHLMTVGKDGKIGSRFAKLRVRSAEPVGIADVAQLRPGQWVLRIDQTEVEAGSKSTNRIVNAAARLGLWPVHFTERFVSELRSAKPLGLVPDTNALYNGFLGQALRMRHGKPTHLVVPDQVFMEVQLHRETKKADGRYHRAVRMLRALSDRSGFIMHSARPPDALVRYFGSDYLPRREEGSVPNGGSSSANVDEPDDVGPSYRRDRLILEAARAIRGASTFPIWLVCGDADLAEQASVEHFNVGFAWLPELPTPPVMTSPWIDPYTLRIQHLPVGELIDELVWTFGGIAVQESGKTTVKVFQVPTEKKGRRDRVRFALGDAVCPVRVSSRTEPRRDWDEQPSKEARSDQATVAPKGRNRAPDGKERSSPGSAGEPTVDRSVGRRQKVNDGESGVEHSMESDGSAPARAPGAGSLLKGLLGVQRAGEAGFSEADLPRDVVPYLVALRWASRSGALLMPTARGLLLAEQWLDIEPDDAPGWIAWHRAAARDVGRLSQIQHFLSLLPAEGGATVEDLVKASGLGERIVESQARFVAVFGLAGRTHAHVFRTRSYEGDEPLADTIAREVRRLRPPRSDDESPPIRVDDLYLSLLRQNLLSFVDFRAGLLRLREMGCLSLGGSAPDVGASGRPVKVQVLRHGTGNQGPELKEIDLGAGDFLVPGKSTQILRLVSPGGDQ